MISFRKSNGRVVELNKDEVLLYFVHPSTSDKEVAAPIKLLGLVGL